MTHPSHPPDPAAAAATAQKPPTGTLRASRVGYIYVALAAVLWAGSGASSKFLFNQGMTPFDLVQLRTTISFVGLLLWMVVRNFAHLKIAPRDLFYFFCLGTFGVAGAQFFYFFAISKITVAAAILLHYMGPIFIALYAVGFAREKLKGSTLLSIAGAMIGCALVVEAYDLNILSLNRIGIFGGILAALAFATYSVLGEYGMRKYNPWTVLVYAMLFAALTWNLLHPPLKAFFRPYSVVEWGWILYIGIMGTVLPFGFYFEGINRIRSTHASITATLEPITAGFLSFIFLGEVMGPLQLLGGVLVLASIVWLQLNQEPDEMAPHRIRYRQK